MPASDDHRALVLLLVKLTLFRPPCRDAAISSRRDIKKAIQQFARCRPDIVLRLPQQLLTDLASQKYPALLEKKTRIAVERLQADTARIGGKQGPAHATGRASTQDVLRAMWGLTNTSPGSTTAAAAAVAVGDDSSQLDPVAGELLYLQQPCSYQQHASVAEQRALHAV